MLFIVDLLMTSNMLSGSVYVKEKVKQEIYKVGTNEFKIETYLLPMNL